MGACCSKEENIVKTDQGEVEIQDKLPPREVSPKKTHLHISSNNPIAVQQQAIQQQNEIRQTHQENSNGGISSAGHEFRINSIARESGLGDSIYDNLGWTPSNKPADRLFHPAERPASPFLSVTEEQRGTIDRNSGSVDLPVPPVDPTTMNKLSTISTTCLEQMLNIIPPNVAVCTLDDLTNLGMNQELATRVQLTKCLWIIRMSSTDIENIQTTELTSTFNCEGRDLDLVEMGAIVASLPNPFARNSGSKASWRNTLEGSYIDRVTAYLDGGLDDIKLRHPAYLDRDLIVLALADFSFDSSAPAVRVASGENSGTSLVGDAGAGDAPAAGERSRSLFLDASPMWRPESSKSPTTNGNNSTPITENQLTEKLL